MHVLRDRDARHAAHVHRCSAVYSAPTQLWGGTSLPGPAAALVQRQDKKKTLYNDKKYAFTVLSTPALVCVPAAFAQCCGAIQSAAASGANDSAVRNENRWPSDAHKYTIRHLISLLKICARRCAQILRRGRCQVLCSATSVNKHSEPYSMHYSLLKHENFIKTLHFRYSIKWHGTKATVSSPVSIPIPHGAQLTDSIGGSTHAIRC